MKLNVNLKKIGKKQHSVQTVTYEIPGNPGNVRELIEAMVRTCVEQYNQRPEESGLLSCLTKDEIEDSARTGKVGFGVNYGNKTADAGQAIDNAIQSFEDGIYRIFLDDRGLEALDEEITVKEESSLTFVRLTMLAGRMW